MDDLRTAMLRLLNECGGVNAMKALGRPLHAAASSASADVTMDSTALQSSSATADADVAERRCEDRRTEDDGDDSGFGAVKRSREEDASAHLAGIRARDYGGRQKPFFVKPRNLISGRTRLGEAT